MIATALNIILNFLLIPLDPEHGYVIAAYTTLAGYIVLFILHYFIVRHMQMSFVYDIKYIILVLITVTVISGVMNLLYGSTIIRYAITVIYGSIVLFYMYRYKTEILQLVKKK